MATNLHWHKREKASDSLRKKLRGALRVQVDPEAVSELVALMKKKGIISSRRDLARKTGLCSSTLDDLCTKKVDSKFSTIQVITKFALNHMRGLYGGLNGVAPEERIVDDLLGGEHGLRRDLVEALRGN